jgi:hypothetical protein
MAPRELVIIEEIENIPAPQRLGMKLPMVDPINNPIHTAFF